METAALQNKSWIYDGTKTGVHWWESRAEQLIGSGVSYSQQVKVPPERMCKFQQQKSEFIPWEPSLL